MLDDALRYREAGFSVIPIRPDFDPVEKKFLKKPYVNWKKYQTEKTSEEEIRGWWSKWPGAMIGIVTGEISKLYGIDCDSEEAYQAIQEMLTDSFLTPTLITPRGGHHLWVTCSNGVRLRTIAGVLPNLDTRGDGGYLIAPPSKNASGGSYQWLDGLSFLDVAPQELHKDIIYTLKGGVVGGGSEIMKSSNTTQYYTDYKILQKGTRDQDLFSIGMALSDGHYSFDKIGQVLEILAKNCNPPFSETELSEKIKSIKERALSKDRNLSDEVREWCLLQKGYFNTTTILHELQITTKLDKKNLTVIINRLQTQGIIEKYGEKRGEYRTKDDKANLEMNFIEGEIPEFDVTLPFGLSRIVSIYPKNIIIVAGSKSSGKTAFLMNIAKANRDKHEVIYLNSEMGDEEWSNRLRKMGITSKSDIRFKALAVHKNFHDMMDGGKKIYIVDYLEIHENFFEIAKPIRQIHEAIKDGICIIAVQKKQGDLLARGGEFSMEKSRLYLSLDFLPDQRCTQMTIVDAKSPKLPESPRGWSKRIKIIDGSTMEVIDKDWKY
jgi:hypothetical protein